MKVWSQGVGQVMPDMDYYNDYNNDDDDVALDCKLWLRRLVK